MLQAKKKYFRPELIRRGSLAEVALLYLRDFA